MNKNIVLIQSHCNNIEKKKLLIENIKKLKKYDLDILLFSHIPLEEEIIEKVDFFIYCKDNPIMWEERRHQHWRVEKNIKYQTIVPDYGWTVFNQMIKSHELIRNISYKFVYCFCYDLVIDDVVERYLLNPKQSIFIHQKPDTVFMTGLVFFIFEKLNFTKIIESLSREEYSQSWGMIAEKYFEEKLKTIGLYETPTDKVTDLIHESKDIFNVSNNESYDLFLDNQNLLKFKIFNKTDKKIKIIINDKLIEVGYGEYVHLDKMENLDTLGCIVDNIFDNWTLFFYEKKTNLIIPL